MKYVFYRNCEAYELFGNEEGQGGHSKQEIVEALRRCVVGPDIQAQIRSLVGQKIEVVANPGRLPVICAVVRDVFCRIVS